MELLLPMRTVLIQIFVRGLTQARRERVGLAKGATRPPPAAV
jgi:hypothetical protein